MLERNLPAVGALLVSSLLAAPVVAVPGEPGGAGGGTLPLSEILDEARIESPLLGVEPAEELSDLVRPTLDVLLDQGFEDFDWAFEGWDRAAGIEVVEDGDGHVLRLEGVEDRPALGWVRPVHSDSFYRFERSVRAMDEPFCDFYVVESRVEFEQARPDPQTYFLAGRGQALKVHAAPMRSDPESRGQWQRTATSFFPSPRTRSLVILIRPRTGADPDSTVRGMAFDDLRLEEVRPTSSERIRLLKAAHPALDADPARGMRKSGWLLPLPSPEGVQAGEPAESNYNWREALYAPPTTTLAFDLSIPERATLRLATGLARETRPGAAARFQVEVAAPGGAEPVRLLDQVRAAEMEDWHWEDVDLDLGPWAGTRATVTLRTEADKGDPHCLWGNPRIETVGESDPLVILIAVDTLRADRLSVYGYERETSPALDRLAAEGVRFDQARSNCNWTCPSFASIFTGLVPSRHGVTSYGPATPLPDELVTLAEHFQGEGWATRSIAYKVPLFDGNYEQGFDQAFNVPRDRIRGEENLARALEWLDSHRGGPTFLFLHFNDPHQPFIHPEPLDREFGSASTLAAAFGIPGEPDRQEDFAELYDGAVAYVDSCIGRFLDALRERRLYDTATVAFVADHGEALWEHGRFGHGGDQLFDEVVRIPLIVKPPAGTFKPGRVVKGDVSAFDVMPTLLELAGIQPADELDARSLMPLISGSRRRLGRPVVTETSGRGLALVDGGFKYVLQTRSQEEALFHLESDPEERQDIAAELPGQLALMRSQAIEYLLSHRSGDYVLAHTGSEPATLRFGTHAVRGLAGVPPTAARSRSGPDSHLTLPGDTWSLFEIEAADADDVGVSGLEVRGVATGFEPWVPGRLEDLSGPGLWRVRGPQPRVVREVAPEDEQAEEAPVDLEMLEALRRLGYTGD